MPVEAIAAIRQTREGLADDCAEELEMRARGLEGRRRSVPGAGSVGRQLVFAALKARGLTAGNMRLVFLLASDAEVRLNERLDRSWSTWEPVAWEEVLFEHVGSSGGRPHAGLQAFAFCRVQSRSPTSDDSSKISSAA